MSENQKTIVATLNVTIIGKSRVVKLKKQSYRKIRWQGEKLTLLKERATDLYQWASQETAEAVQISESIERHKAERTGIESHDFFETEFFKLLVFRVKNTPHALLSILGLQGTGKSSTLNQLSRVIPNSIYFKWNANWLKTVMEWPSTQKTYLGYLHDEAQELFTELGHKDHLPKWMKKHVNNVGELSPALQEKIIGRAKAEELKKDAANLALEGKDLILLDMPDYSKYDPSSMNKDFEELQKFWYSMQSSETGFVIAMQKEIVMRHPHFFIGKTKIMNLEPLRTDDLISAFKFLRPDDLDILGDDALRTLAELSRGVFRRFKRYIGLTCEANLNTVIPLQREHAEIAITETVLFESMELELGEIFKERGKRIEALKTLNYVRQNPKTNIKSIAESLNITEPMVQRLVHNLELYGYVVLSRGQGKELLVSLR